MPRVASRLLSGSTLLIRRPISSLSSRVKLKNLASQTSDPHALHTDRCHHRHVHQRGQFRSYTSPPRAVLEALTMKKCVVVGISGVTNGGKTSLCERLEKDLPMATHINMDDYFYDPSSGKIPLVEELNHGNYEDTRAIDFTQIVSSVNQWVSKAAEKPIEGHPQILFIEGILIFNHRPLVPFYSLKYFLTLTKEQCWERRKHRCYDPPDPPGYFDLVVWPMYLKNKRDIQDQKDIVYLDGMGDPEDTYKRVLSDIKAYLEE